jgi:hypothetical protein
MIPAQPHTTNSQAEKKVFDLLRTSFSDSSHVDWFAMHSLNLPRHEYKRFGEIDFVICGQDGLFVLEVKGGRVACHDGVWETTDRYGDMHPLKESPFKQAETALHGLVCKLPADLSTHIVIGYGVVTPDVEWSVLGAEWDAATHADARACRNFEKWLGRLTAYWKQKDPFKPTLNADKLKALQHTLRPDFEAVKPLHVDVHMIEESIARLTSDQLHLIDIVEANDRVICRGGAGTGKTMLAVELARRWSAAGMKVALACQSPWLKGYLERKAPSGLTVSMVETIHVTARRAGIDKFDALIVDEGQDVLNFEALEKLENVLQGGLDNGRWCFFHDVNNQSGLCGEYTPDAYDYLASFNPARVPLTSNCRNTAPILKAIQESLEADLGNASVGDGPAVRTISVNDAETDSEVLARELRLLVRDHGFEPYQIVVLSPKPFAQSCASNLPQNAAAQIVAMDSYSPNRAGRQHIGFAEIANFKGLESDVVVLVDLPAPGQDKATRAFHYTGMSRARALLSMIFNRSVN